MNGAFQDALEKLEELGIFLDEDFLSVNKTENTNWEDVKHIIISLIILVTNLLFISY